jgi:hypothetical protein
VSSSATELICVDTTVWSEKSISLDLPGNDLVEAVTNNGLYLATLSRGILVLNQDTWQFTKVPGSEGSRFARIASSDGHLIAVGYDLEKQLQLWSSVRHTGTSESKLLSQDAMAGFCVSTDKVYVAGQARIFYLDLHSMTKVMKRIDLPAGLTTQPDLLVLTNKHGESRLIVKRIATGRAEVNMLDPVTGAISSIAVTPTLPSLCVADSKLVISSLECGEVKLRTYLSQENP